MRNRHKRHFILVLLSAVMLMSRAYAGFSMDILDVGAGDCILLRTDHATLLIDTGPPRAWKHIEPFLLEQNVTNIDTLLLTHSHPDHCGNTTNILSSFPVNEILISSVDIAYSDDILLLAADLGLPVRMLTRGDHFSLDSLQCDVLWPDNEACELINDRSVVLLINYHDFRMLFMADAESETERRLLQWTDPSLLQANLIKIGHHGMITSSTYPLIRAVRPTYALVSCGDNDHNATISPFVRDTLTECGVSWILPTSEYGDIHLEITDSGILTIR